MKKEQPDNLTQVVYEARGTHLLLTLSRCAVENLNDESYLRDLTERAATATGATVLQLASQRFSPQGVTAVAVLAESHASLHTYPESAVVFWDCFTCGDTCIPSRSVEVLVEALKPEQVNQQTVARG
jgi:S-adenosylmethionine decarboxylase